MEQSRSHRPGRQGGETSAPAPLARRLAAMVYEALIVTALVFLAGLIFLLVDAGLTGQNRIRVVGGMRLALQVYLVAVVGTYFVWFWCRGQTLPMKTWRLRLVGAGETRVTGWRALARYLVSLVLFGAALVGVIILHRDPSSLAGMLAVAPALAALLWAFFDRDRQMPYDRLAGTRLVRAEPRSAPSRSNSGK